MRSFLVLFSQFLPLCIIGFSLAKGSGRKLTIGIRFFRILPSNIENRTNTHTLVNDIINPFIRWSSYQGVFSSLKRILKHRKNVATHHEISRLPDVLILRALRTVRTRQVNIHAASSGVTQPTMRTTMLSRHAAQSARHGR